MDLHKKIKQDVLLHLSRDQNDIIELNDALRLLAKHRSLLIQNTFLKHEGLTVQQGPLAGLQFLEGSAEGCHVAKLIGCYEQPIARHINRILSSNYDVILNIGCAEGYYAVGMARKLKDTKIYAFDLDSNARSACRKLAKTNGVSDKIVISGEFNKRDFQKFKNRKTIIFCDIEGAEVDLLDPQDEPSLKNMDVIVEVHELEAPNALDALYTRFCETHEIEIIRDNGQRELNQMPNWFLNLSHLDQILSIWEWRTSATPWLVMTAKKNL